MFIPCVVIDRLLFPRRWEYWNAPDELIDTLYFVRQERAENRRNNRTLGAWKELLDALEYADEPYRQLQMINEKRDESEAMQLRREIHRRAELVIKAREKYETASIEIR